MAKKQKNTVSITRGSVSKEIIKAQWDAMKSSNSTYGWKLSSDLSEDVLKKDKQLEGSKINELEAKLADFSKENEALKGEIKAWEITVGNLQAKITELTPEKEDNSKAPKDGKKGTDK